MTAGHLRAQGIKVKRSDLRSSLRRVDPEGVTERRRTRGGHIFCCTRLELVDARVDEAEVVAVDVTDVVAFVLELVGKGLKKVATALATTLPNSSGLNEAIKTSNFLR